jgi:hypothetical protein
MSTTKTLAYPFLTLAMSILIYLVITNLFGMNQCDCDPFNILYKFIRDNFLRVLIMMFSASVASALTIFIFLIKKRNKSQNGNKN